jgi:hypothetical protein
VDRIKIKFELKFVVLIVGTILSVASAWFFTKNSPSFESVIDILQIGLTFSALIYTAMSINASALVNQQAVAVKQKEKVFEFLERFHELDEKGITRRSRLARESIKGKSADTITSTLNENEENRAALFTTLNFFESLALAVTHRIADDNVAYGAFKSIVISHRNSMLTFIEKYRLDNNSPSYLENFADLAECWSKRT